MQSNAMQAQAMQANAMQARAMQANTMQGGPMQQQVNVMQGMQMRQYGSAQGQGDQVCRVSSSRPGQPGLASALSALSSVVCISLPCACAILLLAVCWLSPLAFILHTLRILCAC